MCLGPLSWEASKILHKYDKEPWNIHKILSGMLSP